MLSYLLSLSSVDHSRICLQRSVNDYINASLITVEEAQRNYILTQVKVEPKPQKHISISFLAAGQ